MFLAKEFGRIAVMNDECVNLFATDYSSGIEEPSWITRCTSTWSAPLCSYASTKDAVFLLDESGRLWNQDIATGKSSVKLKFSSYQKICSAPGGKRLLVCTEDDVEVLDQRAMNFLKIFQDSGSKIRTISPGLGSTFFVSTEEALHMLDLRMVGSSLVKLDVKEHFGGEAVNLVSTHSSDSSSWLSATTSKSLFLSRLSDSNSCTIPARLPFPSLVSSKICGVDTIVQHRAGYGDVVTTFELTTDNLITYVHSSPSFKETAIENDFWNPLCTTETFALPARLCSETSMKEHFSAAMVPKHRKPKDYRFVHRWIWSGHKEEAALQSSGVWRQFLGVFASKDALASTVPPPANSNEIPSKELSQPAQILLSKWSSCT